MSEGNLGPRDRYNRFSEDWRFHHKLIWEIPGITSAVIGGILTVSYSFLGLVPRSFLLFIGAMLVLGLALVVRKHRFGADLRTNFLEDIGLERRTFPVRSKEGLRYLR